MNQEPRTSSGTRWTPLLIGLGVVAVLVGGVVIGLMASDGDPPTSTTLLSSASSTSSLPTTTSTAATSTTTTAPSTTVATEPVEMSFQVSEDATISSDDPNEVFGETEFLELEYNSPDSLRALLRFEVDGIPEGHTVVSARLRVFLVEGSRGGGLISAVSGDWTESTITWNNAPLIGPAIAPLPIGGEGTDIDIDVSPAVSGNGVIDFYMRTFSDNDYVIASKESGHGPVLILTVAEGPNPDVARGTILVGAGDIAACDSDGDEATAALLDDIVASATEAVVFTTGDNAYEAGTAANFADCYEPSWGRHKAITRPTPGSREYRTPGASAYFAYFGESAGTSGEGWYSYEVGDWHVIALNANCAEVGGCNLDSPQGIWLQRDIESSVAVCTVAYWHDPVFSSTEEGGNPELAEFYQYLHDADVEIVVNGDDHFYERFLPQDAFGEDADSGLRQFTVGTGGRSLAAFGVPASNSAVRFNESFGVLVLSLGADGYTWEFVTQEGALFVDSGSDSCHD